MGMSQHQAMAYITAEIIHAVRSRYPYDLATEILSDGSVIFGHNGDTYVGVFEPSNEPAHQSIFRDRLTFQRAEGEGIHPPYLDGMNCE